RNGKPSSRRNKPTPSVCRPKPPTSRSTIATERNQISQHERRTGDRSPSVFMMGLRKYFPKVISTQWRACGVTNDNQTHTRSGKLDETLSEELCRWSGTD